MKKLVKTSRVVFIFLMLALILAVYGSTLYKLQIIEGASYYDESANTYTVKYSVPAVRGDILDRNGKALVSSEASYNVMISRSAVLRSGDPNGNLLGIVNTAEEYGAEYTDTFPMTKTGPFEYSAAMSSEQTSRLGKYFEYFKLDADMSASDFFVWMKEHYGIAYTTPLSDARKIIGVRYELELRVIVNIDDYVFVKNAETDMIAALLERGYAGVYVGTSSTRSYQTSFAAHLLGYTGLMNQREYEEYKELGYSMNAIVGKDGAEAAFEEYLHGTDGAMSVTTNDSGAVVGTKTTKEAVAGGNVYLTIDIAMQAVAEKALADTISVINATRTGEGDELAEGGAIVAIDVSTGELLASASYPTYDISSFWENYAELESSELYPLLNRAMMGRYNPGSTFKMVTALAGMKYGAISPYTTIKDEGKYKKYTGFQPVCWVYPYGDHGNINVVGALEQSCNYFFYSVGDALGINAIANTAREFGFGSKTGVEIAETAGTLATPEYKQEELHEGWWAADTLITAIGQGHNLFTPVQIANYVATIANGGTNYKVTMLNSVTTHDYSAILKENEPVARHIIDDTDGYIGVLKSGMEAVAKTGTAASMFAYYSPSVAAKTGTVQSDTTKVNSGVFVCYAPASAPEIAVAVVVENGGSGSAIMDAAKAVLDYYFTEDSVKTSVVGEGVIIG